MNSVIIVAAGAGSRFGGDIPKQFVKLAGKPLIMHTLERFEMCRAVDEIILVLSRDAIDLADGLIDRAPLTKLKRIAAGGDTRAESVRNGLSAVAANCEVVAVHDGARPLVRADEIERVIAAARLSGAACLVAGLTDTIKSVQGGKISGTVDRDVLRRALTPQAFKLEVLREAFDNAVLDDTVTDECCLVESLGHEIATVEGSARNIKITHADDMAIAQALLEREHS
jgi:2-C-methyl-D-erythritol 4-phosphate cytidylyltransferase